MSSFDPSKAVLRLFSPQDQNFVSQTSSGLFVDNYPFDQASISSNSINEEEGGHNFQFKGIRKTSTNSDNSEKNKAYSMKKIFASQQTYNDHISDKSDKNDSDKKDPNQEPDQFQNYQMDLFTESKDRPDNINIKNKFFKTTIINNQE